MSNGFFVVASVWASGAALTMVRYSTLGMMTTFAVTPATPQHYAVMSAHERARLRSFSLVLLAGGLVTVIAALLVASPLADRVAVVAGGVLVGIPVTWLGFRAAVLILTPRVMVGLLVAMAAGVLGCALLSSTAAAAWSALAGAAMMVALSWRELAPRGAK